MSRRAGRVPRTGPTVPAGAVGGAAGGAVRTVAAVPGTPAAPDPSDDRDVVDRPDAADQPDAPVGPGEVGVRWLGHASVVLDVGGVRLLTDPLLRAHAGLLRRSAPRPRAASWAGAGAVLLSHLHHDHAELGSLALLGDVPVLCAPANAHWLVGHGVRGALGLPPDTWWTVPGSSVRVRTVTAVHGHRPMPHRPNAANGFLVVADAAAGGGAVGAAAGGAGTGAGTGAAGTGGADTVRIWFAGDTEPFPAMRHLPDLAGGPVDLALVPVGGWGPRLSGGHLDPVQAAEACLAVGARRAVPVHWGTLHAPASRRLPPGWMDRAGPAFAAALDRAGAGATEAVVLAPGERLVLGRGARDTR